MSELPHELFEGVKDDSPERLARIGRFLVLEECGYFGQESNIDLAKAKGLGTWTAQVRKRFSGTYGNVRGCDAADLEIAAEMLGVFDDIYDVESYDDAA